MSDLVGMTSAEPVRAASLEMGPRLGLAITEPVPGSTPPLKLPESSLPANGPVTIPYLPAPTLAGAPDYGYQIILRPTPGATVARAEFSRYIWNVTPESKEAFLSEAPPLTVEGQVGVPIAVDIPPGLDSNRPQCWVVKETTAADILIGAIPRKATSPLLQIIPGQFPAGDIGDHVMALPPRVDLPEMRDILPCKLQVFPITKTCGIAVRFRMSEQGSATGVTPYLFKATLTAPRSWNLLSGRRLIEEDPVSGKQDELVEATPQIGQVAPVVTVFAGRCLASFSWRATPSAPCFNIAGLVPEDRPPEEAQETRPSLYGSVEEAE